MCDKSQIFVLAEALGLLFQFCQSTFGYHGIGTMSFHP